MKAKPGPDAQRLRWGDKGLESGWRGARAQAAWSMGVGVGQPPEGRWPSEHGLSRRPEVAQFGAPARPAHTCPGAGPRDRKGGQERGLVAAGPRKSPGRFYFLRERGSLALSPGRTLAVGGEEEPQSSAQERGHPGRVQG